MNAYDIYNQRLFARADMLGVPLSGTFELTPRCNFRCKMCYIHRAEHDAAARAAERSAAQWLALAEQCCREGTLMLLLTGGEPLLRPDFREIYTGCKRMGLVLSVNTNASLIDDDMVELFAANPPRRVNITLYGASPETYGALCGSREAYARVEPAKRGRDRQAQFLRHTLQPPRRAGRIRFCGGAPASPSGGLLYVSACPRLRAWLLRRRPHVP